MQAMRYGFFSLLAVLVWPAPVLAAPPPDPLAGYYGNTLVCAGARDGMDSCHIWLQPGGGFILFGLGQGGHTGRYTVAAATQDSAPLVCLKLATPDIDIPPALRLPQPASNGPSPDLLMLARFHAGICFALGPHTVGDQWAQSESPAPDGVGADRFSLLPGHQ